MVNFQLIHTAALGTWPIRLDPFQASCCHPVPLVFALPGKVRVGHGDIIYDRVGTWGGSLDSLIFCSRVTV